MSESEDRLDPRLKALLFPPAPAADPRRVEAFVSRVMSRVRDESVATWERWLWRLGSPALAAGLAALLLALATPGVDADEPLDAQLLADGGGPLSAVLALDDASLLRVAP